MDENVIANDSKMLVLYKNIKKQLGSTELVPVTETLDFN
jgi:hypothetical protein